MATYGRGQMLGSGINPESFKQDYSGFARAAETQAQGMANLGASIGGAIKDFGEAKKEQKKVDAYNKASAKAIEAAITLGGSYGITGAEETLRPFLEAYNDPSLSPIEKAALLDEGKGMIPNVFGRFDASQADAIQRAQIDARNAPPMPEQFGFTGSELKKTDKGDLYVLKGNDGLDYDPKTKLPIFDLAAFGEGLPPEVWSGSSTFSDDQGSVTTPFASLPGEGASDAIDYANSLTGNMQGSGFPTNLNVARPAPFLSPSQIESAANLGSNPLLGTQSGDNRDLLAIEAANQADLQPRYITDEGKAEELEGTEMTLAEVEELANKGVKINAVPLGGGKFRVTESTFGNKPMVEVNTAQSSQEGRAKEMDKMLFETKKQLEGASQNKDSIIKMVNLLDEGVKTGFAQGAIMQFNKAFGRDVSDSETFKSVAGDVAMGFINLTKGAISDREMTYFTTVLAPNIGNTVEGNKKIGAFMLSAIKKAEKIEKVISEGLREGKKAFDIDEEVRAIRNADDLLSDTPGSESTPTAPLTLEDELNKVIRGEKIE
jgi:hypothetical protein